MLAPQPSGPSLSVTAPHPHKPTLSTERPDFVESTALGAAICAAIGAGCLDATALEGEEVQGNRPSVVTVTSSPTTHLPRLPTPPHETCAARVSPSPPGSVSLSPQNGALDSEFCSSPVLPTCVALREVMMMMTCEDL